ncbi:MAG: glycosyltransferase [Candidatus Omnitrophica bacterium]|nr:glycosyltransferase [Candidatus Omnitrophota bacterium]
MRKESNNKIASIVIVTCGAKDYLRSCLDSIREQTYKNLEIIVIDNSLNQNFSKEIIRCYPEIKLYSEMNNLFYAGALNKGIEVSQGDFILCLNDDVILDGQFIQEGLYGFYRDTSVGMVSGKILRSDGVVIDSTGLVLSLWRTAKERGYGSRDRGQYNCPGYIFGVNGAVAFYSRKMLESIKVSSEYFASDFRMFYEDLDIAWRGNLFGWKAYYYPRAVAYHVRGGTARQTFGAGQPYARRYLSDELHSDLIKNRYLSIIKNESVFGFLLHLPFTLFYDFLIGTYVLFFRPRLLKRLFLDLKYLKSALKKRIAIKNMRCS